MKKFTLFIFALFMSFTLVKAQDLPLIPYPAQIKINEGSFTLSKETLLILSDEGKFTNEVNYLQRFLSPIIGQNLKISGALLVASPNETMINIIHSNLVEGDEGYSLEITPTEVTIKAKTPAGAFYAIQTIRQLLPVEAETGKELTSVSLPALKIVDKPAFEWRGSHIDVSRHFFSSDYIKRHIDRLALYKMNKFHWHLTDDQGWRIEIKQYPDLITKGAWRNYSKHDTMCMKMAVDNPDLIIDSRYIIKKEGQKDMYGGFFTQGEIKDIIQYAAERHIEIIPEIDMPGHMDAVVKIYPHLSCSGKSAWGELFSTPLCPCNEDTYTFVENVLTEIIDLFPSKYIHIGADEVDKKTWEESLPCKELMEKEGLKNVNELQSYFVHRMQDFIQSKGKTVIGWDEVLQGGIDSKVDIMYWRGWVADAPLKAVNNGNRVIMTPTNPMYFDFLPNKSTLYNVYHMDIIYKDIPADKAHLIRGAQANMWAEKIPTERRADFMLFPRMLALAERTWTYKEQFESFSQRILSHYPRLDALGVNYRLPDVEGFAEESVFVDKTYFDIKSPLAEMQVHYTLDGSVPEKTSAVLKEPILINKPQQIKFALFSPGGAHGEIYTVNYRKMPLMKAVKAKNLTNGLKMDFYNKRMNKTTKITGEPTKTFVVNNVVMPTEAKAPSFGARFTGYIDVPQDGIYSFYFTIDDSGMLYIGDETIVDNEGPHSPVEKSGQAALKKGLHPLKIDFVEGGGGYTLRLEYSVNGSPVKPVPDSWFKHE